MKIFISSLISGFEPFRAAARAAVKTLRHEAKMAEDFTGTSPRNRIPLKLRASKASEKRT
jgi:hypothetical protein